MLFVVAFYTLASMIVMPHLTSAGDDDEDSSSSSECIFEKLLAVKTEKRQVMIPLVNKTKQRELCVHWEIFAPSTNALEVQIIADQYPIEAFCKEGYVKIYEDDCEVSAQSKRWSKDQTFTTKGSDVKINFRPGYCRTNLTFTYRTVPKIPLPDKKSYGSHETDVDVEDDGDSSKDDNVNHIANNVVAVLAPILAVMFVVLAIFLIVKWLRQRTRRNTAQGEESATFHLCSKPGGYTATQTEEHLPGMDLSPSEKHLTKVQLAGSSQNLQLNGGASPGFTTALLTAPPPYTGASSATYSVFHLREEPPTYLDAVNTKQ